MKILSFVCFMLLICLAGYSQHYYNDIVANQQSNASYKRLKQSNTGQVKGTSFEADNSPTPHFRLEQELSRDKKKLTTTTTTAANITSGTVSYYENDRLKQTVDTVRGVKNITDYEYDGSGKLTKITSQSIDPEHTGNTIEVHQWFYKANGSPEYMLKIKNRSDSVRVEFTYDEKDNLAEEHSRRKNRIVESYYYYYNDQKLLTDVVRYNPKSKTMLPDYTFDYDEQGRVKEMLQTLQGTTTYLIWKYMYNEHGLKVKEVCFDKTKRLVGTVEYVYSK